MYVLFIFMGTQGKKMGTERKKDRTKKQLKYSNKTINIEREKERKKGPHEIVCKRKKERNKCRKSWEGKPRKLASTHAV